MKILFAAPRYHTNQIPIVEGLLKSGHTVEFWAQFVGSSEDHSALEPVLMKESPVTSGMAAVRRRIYPGAKAESVNARKFIPSLFWVIARLRSMKPDLVITRERGRLTRIITIACKLCGIRKIILYIQDPLYRRPQKTNFRDRVKAHVMPGCIYTPIKYNAADPHMDYRLPHSYFVPLVYTPDDKRSPLHSQYCTDGTLHLLDIGKYRGYKYHFGAVEAMHLLPEGCRADLTIIGQCESDDEKEYRSRLWKKIDEYDLGSRIHLMSNVPYSEMRDIYSRYDMLLLPSRSESA
jgi:glycosyltransferase involved in cell wall biosynthesis